MRFPKLFTRTVWASRVLLPGFLFVAAGCSSTLNRAITHNRKPEIDQLLAAGADVNARDGDGASALINAAQYGDLALIKRLFEHGAQVAAFDHDGNTALMYVASVGRDQGEAGAFLVARGANVNETNHDKMTPLLLAATRSCPPAEAGRQADLIAVLLHAGADPNFMSRRGELPLHLAAFAGQDTKALDLLVHATKDPQAYTQNGFNAFMEAVRGDHRAAATYLASVGIQPQNIPPEAAPAATPGPPMLASANPAVAIAARAHDAYGDCLRDQGDQPGALENYRESQGDYDAAVVEYQRAVDQLTVALKQEKDARRSKWVATIAANTVGVGLAAATGVGFFTVPRSFKNHIDDYTDELERDRAELKVLLAEQSEMTAKILALGPPAKTDPSPAAAATKS
jgi:hypothetical protein